MAREDLKEDFVTGSLGTRTEHEDDWEDQRQKAVRRLFDNMVEGSNKYAINSGSYVADAAEYGLRVPRGW